MDSKGVSIVICTYNGSKLLPPTLEHIARLILIPGVPTELLIIDNASTDNTSEIARDLWRNFGEPFPIRIISEPTPGTMHARRRGILEAQYEFLLYCDDDNWLDEKYLEIGVPIMQNDTRIAACGGDGIPVFETERPEWFHHYLENYGCGPQGDELGSIYPRNRLYTAGLFMRRQVLLNLFDIGFSNYLEGRKEGSIVAGEDTELTNFIALLGYELWYHPELKFKHYMLDSRLTKEYLVKLNKGHYTSSVILLPYTLLWRESVKGQKVITKNLWLIMTIKSWLYMPKRILSKKSHIFFEVHMGRIRAKQQALWRYGRNIYDRAIAIRNLRNKYQEKFGGEVE